ncbi:hypothetical protein [Nocardia alni]|uniref:hypothetical protein n=1 Tax=Nocardia alni TaxID=2815723 RepID=UPI001C2324AC|nr:hypothetical protein [Nocardia alni]
MGHKQRGKAELEQVRRDQDDPRWLEWVAPDLMNARVSKLLTETIPDMPDDPWSAVGLDRVEREILERFTTVQAVSAPGNQEIADQLTRFIGEVFRRKFEGQWYNVPSMGGNRYQDFGPVIRHEWTDMYLDVANLVTSTVDRRWGDNLSEIFGFSMETYRSWVEAGRPPMDEWIKG